jgi:uncharacterized protein (DUF1697 family)
MCAVGEGTSPGADLEVGAPPKSNIAHLTSNIRNPTMPIFIALLRGINVGGNNPLPMKSLVAILEALGAKNARTYIQSGNAVFQSAEKNAATLAARLSAEIKRLHGFEPRVLLLSAEALRTAIAANPFPEGEAEGKTLHLGFLAEAPAAPDLEKLERLRLPSERYELVGKVFYLHAPEGIGRSKMAASIEKCLGVPMTDRNWNTVMKLNEMIDQQN